MTTDLSNLKFETEWANHLGDCLFWLPESLRSQIGQQNDPASWADAYEITGFLRILTLIAEERYDDSLNAVIQHFDESDFQGELFLLRARIHLLLDQFDKIPACFEGAVAYGASDDLINSTYNEISKELDSRNQRPEDQLASANELQELNEHLDLLPSELKAEALKNPSERVLNEELNAFLGILGCLMNGEFEVALNLVRSHFENTAYPGHLFLIRSRIHMLQDDFDSARIALAGAQEFGVSDQVIETCGNNLIEDGETVTANKGSYLTLAAIRKEIQTLGVVVNRAEIQILNEYPSIVAIVDAAKDKANQVLNHEIRSAMSRNNHTFHPDTDVVFQLSLAYCSPKDLIVEIGVWRGHTATVLDFIDPSLEYIGIDPFELPGQAQDIAQLTTMLSPSKRFISSYSSCAAVQLAHLRGKASIVHIDGAHDRANVFNDFMLYRDLLKRGGILIFDDYLDWQYSPDVKITVDDLNHHGFFDDFINLGVIPGRTNYILVRK